MSVESAACQRNRSEAMRLYEFKIIYRTTFADFHRAGGVHSLPDARANRRGYPPRKPFARGLGGRWIAQARSVTSALLIMRRFPAAAFVGCLAARLADLTAHHRQTVCDKD